MSVTAIASQALATIRSAHSLVVTGQALPQIMGVPVLVASKLNGYEALNQLFHYEVELRTELSVSGTAVQNNIDLDALVGREITVHIQLEGRGSFISGLAGESGQANLGAGERQISGIVAKAQYLREDNRQSVYGLTLKPWLHIASLRSDCRIFQNQTVVDVLDKVLSHYAFSTKKRLLDTYPVIDCITQFNESDFLFVERLCQEYGINYHFEHADEVHHLILSDNNGAFQDSPSVAYKKISYYPLGHKIDEEYIHSFTQISQIVTGQFTTTDYDYTRPKANLAVTRSDPRETGQAKHEQYVFHRTQAIDHSQPNAGTTQGASQNDESRGKAIARVRMQALRQHGLRNQGEGNLRGIVTGTSFTLENHPRSLNAEYIVLSTQLKIEDVGQISQYEGNTSAISNQGDQWLVQVTFTVQNSKEIIRPDITHQKPRCQGIESAIVVGPTDDTAASNIYTDYLGRIKIQFPWDRLGKSDQTSSIWIRTSTPWAGNQLGGTFIPRIGQEVEVSFIGGDIDQPIVIRRAYNENNQPPWQLPSQQALSGFRSRELVDGGGNSSAGRSNHFILDDTNKKIQVQFKSDHQASQLSLGDITRIDDNAGRKDSRGEGFELRTDAKGAVRAKDGLLITTEGRSNASAHITDMDETTSRLQQGQNQHASLADLATQAEAQDKTATQEDVSKALESQAKEIKGGDTPNTGGDRLSAVPQGDRSSLSAKAPSAAEKASVPSNSNASSTERSRSAEFTAPHFVFASPAGIAATTPKTTSIHSGEHIALTSGADTSLSVGKSLMVSVKEAIRIYAYKLGIKMIAADKDIDIVALKTNINLTAKLEIKETAENIQLTAKEKVLLNGGGSYIEWKDGSIEEGTSGTHTTHSASKSKTGPANMAKPKLPEPKVFKNNMLFSLSHTPDVTQTHYANHPYTLYKNGAEIESKVTDEWGNVHIKDVKSGEKYTVKLPNGTTFNVPLYQQLHSDEKQAKDQEIAYGGLRNDGESVKARLAQHHRKSHDQDAS